MSFNRGDPHGIYSQNHQCHVGWFGAVPDSIQCGDCGSECGVCCEERKGNRPSLLKCDEEIRQGIETVRGDVLRVEGDNLLVQRSDGKEMRVHLDETTQMFGYVGPGEHVEAKVNKQRHALSICLAE
jgi:hypothetical protein